MRSVVRRIRGGLAELFSLPDGYEVLIGNGGSTLFWDAAVFGLIARRSTHVVIGEFSSKFAAVARAAPHLDEPQVCETEPGARPQLPEGARQIQAYRGPGAPAAGPPHHYTLTLYALNAPLELAANAGRAEVVAGMEGKVLARGIFNGRYKAPAQ